MSEGSFICFLIRKDLLLCGGFSSQQEPAGVPARFCSRKLFFLA